MHFVNTVIPAVFHTIYRVLEGIYRFQRFISLFGSHQVFSMQEFSWLSLYGFYHVLRLAVFPFTHRFWWFVNMLRMCRYLVGWTRRLFAVFSGFSPFRAVAITPFRDYCDSYCFLVHLSGFLCVLVISVVNFAVWGFRCLISVRNSLSLGRRLFSVFSIMLFFLSLAWISVFSARCSWCRNFS